MESFRPEKVKKLQYFVSTSSLSTCLYLFHTLCLISIYLSLSLFLFLILAFSHTMSIYLSLSLYLSIFSIQFTSLSIYLYICLFFLSLSLTHYISLPLSRTQSHIHSCLSLFLFLIKTLFLYPTHPSFTFQGQTNSD